MTHMVDPKAVRAGDAVTVRFVETGEELTTKTYCPDGAPEGWVYILGWPLNKANGTHGLALKNFEILHHEPKKPVYKAGKLYVATVRNAHSITVMRLGTPGSLTGEWAWASSVYVGGMILHREGDVRDIRAKGEAEPAPEPVNRQVLAQEVAALLRETLATGDPLFYGRADRVVELFDELTPVELS